LLLLLPDAFFSPPWLLRLLLLEPLLEALAFSLLPDEALSRLLADLPDEDDDFELPDFMEISLVGGRHHSPGHRATVDTHLRLCVSRRGPLL
jgi:hypothetical protein